MIRLLEMYWAWRRSNESYLTEKGYTVIRVGDKFAVRSTYGKYYDLKSTGFTWCKHQDHFRDCIGERLLIETRCGAILGLPEDDKDVA